MCARCRGWVDGIDLAVQYGAFDKVELSHRREGLFVAYIQVRVKFRLDARQERNAGAVAARALGFAW